MDDVEHTFVDVLASVPFYGMVVACGDDDRVRSLLPRLTRRTVTYGTRAGSDFRIVQASASAGGESCLSRFGVIFAEHNLGEFRLHVPGAHNVLNATAAIAVGVGLDLKLDDIRRGLEAFRGVDRRFQIKGQANGVTVVDDYGHHPTEIPATLAAARQCRYRRVHVVFPPHRYTRTKKLP